MRVILDTNVLVSGVFFGGWPRRILKAWRDGSVRLVYSLAILEEYQRVGDRLAERYDGVDLSPFLQLLGAEGELVEVAALTESVSADPDDEKFLGCAVASGAKVLISGDHHLLQVSGWRGIEVLSPADFCERFLGLDGD